MSFLLAQHSRVMADLWDELSGKLHGDALTFEDSPICPCSITSSKRACVWFLRFVPFEPPHHARDSELGDYRIPAGTEILSSIYHTHRMPGPYRPAAVHARTLGKFEPGPYAYNPFSAGPRMCIGATFAQFEIKVVLAILLQRFRLELVPNQRIDRYFGITLRSPRPACGGRFCATDRFFRSGRALLQRRTSTAWSICARIKALGALRNLLLQGPSGSRSRTEAA